MPYVGRHHEVLARVIQHMKRVNTPGVASILPVIQSSGMGKSRLLHEVAGLIVTIPLNIRCGTAGKFDDRGYPAADYEILDFLRTKIKQNTVNYLHLLYLVFFNKLFAVAAQYLLKMSPEKTYEDEAELALAWREHLENDDDVRKQFLHHVVTEAKAVLDEETGHELYEDLERKALGILDGLEGPRGTEGASAFVEAIKSRLRHGLGDKAVTALLYVDEAHELWEQPVRVLDVPTYLRITDVENLNASAVFTSVFHRFSSSQPIFLAMMSTDPIIRNNRTDFPRFHEPYTATPFDCLLDGQPLFTPGTMTLAEVADLPYLVKFGRPLFATRWKGARPANIGDVQAEIVDFALMKLFCQSVGSLEDEYKSTRGRNLPLPATLAALSVRLLLEFDIGDAEARKCETEMISTHMRVAYSVPHKDADYARSGTPSEPILAEAAARFMNLYFDAGMTMRTLVDAVGDGLVLPGYHHDLIARTLLAFAYDAAVAKQPGRKKALSWPASRTVLFGTPLRVVDFLKELFEERWHHAILNASSDTGAEGAASLQEAFAGAFVRFSHFDKCAKEDTPDAVMALAGVVRGMAFQLASLKEGFHIAIPVVMKDEKLDTDLMSYIFICLTDGYDAVAGRTLDPAHVDAIFSGSRSKHPYIFITMQLDGGDLAHAGDPSTDEDSTYPTQLHCHEPHPDHPCYRLGVTGCSRDIFAALRDNSLGEQFSELLKIGADDREALAPHGVWERGPESYGWIDEPVLQKPIGRLKARPGVIVQ